MHIDIESQADLIPSADLTLAFNVCCFVNEIECFLETLAKRAPRGVVAIRQYDGATLRFGPMNTPDREVIDQALRTALEGTVDYKHYDIDRVFAAINDSIFSDRVVEFELFARAAPFPDDFLDYYNGTLNWTIDHLPPDAASLLRGWTASARPDVARYFLEVDLVALLS